MIGTEVLCISCKWFDKEWDGMGLRCKAFPEGVPDVIATGMIEHTKPFVGDNGLRYEPQNTNVATKQFLDWVTS